MFSQSKREILEQSVRWISPGAPQDGQDIVMIFIEDGKSARVTQPSGRGQEVLTEGLIEATRTFGKS